ncbi:MAG TPA: phenylalanine--tRNA ligase subunit alpha, partial [Microbacterium sp.]|nr:phenylalanine--tRNA ligase subunit alpha [Microbacterium sp.]
MSDVPEITPEAVDAAVEAALAAVAAASDSAALKAARSAHAGEASTLAALNAQLRNVAPENKAAFGKLVGQARGRVNQAVSAREAEL